MLSRVSASTSLLRVTLGSGSHSIRFFSAGSKRDKKEGIPLRRAGGITLPDDDHNATGKGERAKSDKQLSREERAKERAEADWEATAILNGRKKKSSAADRDEDIERSSQAEQQAQLSKEALSAGLYGSRQDHESLGRFLMTEREPLRAGEQSWRERTLAKSGIRIKSQYRQDKTDELSTKYEKLPSSAARNPILARTRVHMNPHDLPPSFDHMSIPPLSAAEIDEKQKALHATYWSKYAAWKEARPDEHAKWLDRLQKRENELEFNWQQSQHNSPKRIEAIKAQEDRKFLPQKDNVKSFEEAMAADPALLDAVKTLGKEEVLRRWSAYQVFLDAELDAEAKLAKKQNISVKKLEQTQALNAEDPIATLNDPNFQLNIGQKKRLYGMLMSAKKQVESAPFWTDPDPRFEGEHDWKMADAFVKPPILPPLHLLRHYSARPELNSNFSALHKFLHFERLRQTAHFLKEQKKTIVREKNREARDMIAHTEALIATKQPAWDKILKDYPFLSDALLGAAQNMHLSPWPPRDQQDFLTALHKNVLLIASLLDAHFSRRNRNASWILSYPRNPNLNEDEPLRAMKRADVKRMEAEVLAAQMMQVLQGGEGAEAAPAAQQTVANVAAAEAAAPAAAAPKKASK